MWQIRRSRTQLAPSASHYADNFKPQCRTTCPLSVVLSLHRLSDASLAEDGPACNRHPFPTLKTLSRPVGRNHAQTSPSISRGLPRTASSTRVKSPPEFNPRMGATEDFDTPPRFREYFPLENRLPSERHLSRSSVVTSSLGIPELARTIY